MKKFFKKLFSFERNNNEILIYFLGIKIRFKSMYKIISKLEENSHANYEILSQILENIDKNFDKAQNQISENNNKNIEYKNIQSRIEYGTHINYVILNQIIQNQILESTVKDFDNKGIIFYADCDEAYNSNDNLYPESTMDGVIRKPRFTNRIKELFGENSSLLDIGCGGGGIVYDALTRGITAFGLDGSSANRKMQNGYWAILHKNLLTCDATKPFRFEKDGQRFKFKVISSWECLEHIEEHDIPNFLKNICDNLDDEGYFIGSISRLPYEDKKRGIVYHVTLKEKSWWMNKFKDSGLAFIEINDSPFEYFHFCRGVGIGWQDEHTNYLERPDDGILFVAKKIN